MSKAVSKEPLTQVVGGVQVPDWFDADTFRSALSYKPRSGDLFLVTFPKCGTTWVGHILVLLFQGGQPLNASSEMLLRAPHIDAQGAKYAEEMIRPGPIRSHLPFYAVPYSEDAKYIYVTRNPKDCCVSSFHFMRDFLLYDFDGTFDQYFEMFLAGRIGYGDYFDHLLSWYQHRNDPNVLLLTYEELKEDIDSAILKMASFIDDEKFAEPLRKDPTIMESIKKYSSFDEMKKFMSKGNHEKFTSPVEDVMQSDTPEIMKRLYIETRSHPKSAETVEKGDPLIRKGIIGDWRNYFSEDQSRRLNEKFDERTKNTEISNLFKKYM